MSFATFLTGITSRAGILTKKASVRIATETGRRLVNREKELGRMLNMSEIKEIITQTVPKKCRPKIITDKKDVFEILKKQGYPEDKILECINNPQMAAANVCNGAKKSVVWLPFTEEHRVLMKTFPILQDYESATVAHELEHSFEINHRIPNIIRRKITPLTNKLGKIFNKNHMANEAERDIGCHKIEENMQMILSMFENQGKIATYEFRPDVKSLKANFKQSRINIDNMELDECVRALIKKEYVSDKNSKIENLRRLAFIRRCAKLEEPAYRATGEIAAYKRNLNSEEFDMHSVIASMYKILGDIAKQERKSLLSLHNLF